MSRSAIKPKAARPSPARAPAPAPVSAAASASTSPGALLGRELSMRTVLFHQAIAERVGLSVTEHKCLDLLDRAEAAMTAGDLARASGLTSGAITGVVDRLERAGFVTREANPADRRQVILRLNPERMRDFEPLFAPFQRSMGAMMARFDSRELAVIADFSSSMIEVLRTETERLRQPPAPVEPAPEPVRRRGRPPRRR
jgi:DNA-binding MarR family transcriptional regulator